MCKKKYLRIEHALEDKEEEPSVRREDKPRSGARMQPTAQAVGFIRKIEPAPEGQKKTAKGKHQKRKSG